MQAVLRTGVFAFAVLFFNLYLLYRTPLSIYFLFAHQFICPDSDIICLFLFQLLDCYGSFLCIFLLTPAQLLLGESMLDLVALRS